MLLHLKEKGHRGLLVLKNLRAIEKQVLYLRMQAVLPKLMDEADGKKRFTKTSNLHGVA